jgi:hypothetical protein
MAYAENGFYGHDQILLAACGGSLESDVPVRIQHGWQPGPGMSDRSMREPGPKLVWSSRNVAAAEAAGHRDVVPIGAPFVYLPARADDGPSKGARSLLAVPFHGWESQALRGTMDDYADELRRLQAQGWGPITVCLYWFEYEQPEARAAFESRGLETTTMGHREENPEFLERQRSLIRAHSAVTSNRVSTVTFYALHSGRPFFLHGPCAGLSESDDPTGESYDAWQRDEFPQLAGPDASERCDTDLGARELGASHRMPPDRLRDALLIGADHEGKRARLRRRRAVARALRTLRAPFER